MGFGCGAGQAVLCGAKWGGWPCGGRRRLAAPRLLRRPLAPSPALIPQPAPRTPPPQVRPEYIIPLVEEFHGKKWPKFNSEKICHIAYGRIQVRRGPFADAALPFGKEASACLPPTADLQTWQPLRWQEAVYALAPCCLATTACPR